MRYFAHGIIQCLLVMKEVILKGKKTTQLLSVHSDKLIIMNITPGSSGLFQYEKFTFSTILLITPDLTIF